MKIDDDKIKKYVELNNMNEDNLIECFEKILMNVAVSNIDIKGYAEIEKNINNAVKVWKEFKKC